MGLEQRDRVRLLHSRGNWRQEDHLSATDASFSVHDEALPDGSRMTREGHVRFCEGPKVKFLRPTLLVIFNEQHLRHLLKSYKQYYNEFRTHLSLDKDPPIPRDAERVGRVLPLPILGGLHHRYARV
jgi:hypothetical protein